MSWQEWSSRVSTSRNSGTSNDVANPVEPATLTAAELSRLVEQRRAAGAGTDSVREYRRWKWLRAAVKRGYLKPGS